MTLSDAVLGVLDLNTVEASGVHWILEDIKGWGSSSGTLTPVQKPRQDGAWGGQSYRKPRSIVLTGSCVAPTAALATDALDRLNDADSLDDTTLTISESGISRWATVRQDGEVLPVWMGATAFSYSIQLVAVDPRKFGTAVSGTTGLPLTSGGLTIPYTVPYSINSTVVSGQVSLFNPGNQTGPVSLTINGPITAPIVTHVGSGLALVFASSLSLGASEFLTVDMARREVLAQGQSSRNQWITSRGWSFFEPGWNTWSFAAATYGAGTMTVTGTPAWK